jgi:hypothetical protein
MENLQEFEVRAGNGRKGTVLRTSRFLDNRAFNTVKFSDGDEIAVPAAKLRPQQDGSFFLDEGDGSEQRSGNPRTDGSSPLSLTLTPQSGKTEGSAIVSTGPDGEPQAGPNILAAEDNVSNQRVAKVLLEEEARIEASLSKEEIEIQRIPINRVLEAPVETHVENGVTIIPVMEEVLKVEKQLILREEIRISKKRTVQRGPQIVSLRKDGTEAGPHSNQQR